MREDILSSIQTRLDFFEQYYTVPDTARPDVDAFVAQMHELGEQSADAADFEARFAAAGMNERFTALLVCCTPKAAKLTDEQKQYSRQVARELFEEDKERIIKEGVLDTVDHVAVELNEEAIAARRKAMIRDGVYDDYTRASNAVDYATEGIGLLGKLFGKKKK